MSGIKAGFQPPAPVIPDVPMFDFTVPVINLQVVGTPTLSQAFFMGVFFTFVLGWLLRRFHRQIIVAYIYLKNLLHPKILDVLEAVGLGIGALVFLPLKCTFMFNDWWNHKVEQMALEYRPVSPPLASESVATAGGKKGK